MSTKREGDETYSKVELDEPMFVLRAQDRCAPETVRLWALTAKRHGAPQEKVEDARRLADRMEAWQRIHGCKVPD